MLQEWNLPAKVKIHSTFHLVDSPFSGGVAKGGQVFNEAVVCDAAGLFETRHPFLDFNVHVVVVYKVMKVVLGDNFFGDDVDWEAHVFEVSEWGAVVEVFDFFASKMAVGGGDGAVEE